MNHCAQMDDCRQWFDKITCSNPFNVTEHDLCAFYISVRIMAAYSHRPEPHAQCDPLAYFAWFFEGAPPKTIGLIKCVIKHTQHEFTPAEHANLMRAIIRQNLS